MGCFQELATDPFVLFCVSCIIIPPVVEGMNREAIVAYAFHYTFLFTAALIAAVYWFTKSGETVTLSKCDRWKARWYLLNGAVIHILLDGMTGVHKLNPTFARQYAEIDGRYGAALGSFEGSAVHVISALELYVYGPMCLWLYYLYHRGLPQRDALEFATCIAQLYGTIVYAGQEIISGMTLTQCDRNLTFSMAMLKNFWFAFVLGNTIWVIIPSWLGYEAWNRLVAASDMNQAPPKKREPKGKVSDDEDSDEGEASTPSRKKSTRNATPTRRRKA